MKRPGLSRKGASSKTAWSEKARGQLASNRRNHKLCGEGSLGAKHALLFWFSLVVFCPILLWALFDARKRCLHDILAGVLFINRP